VCLNRLTLRLRSPASSRSGIVAPQSVATAAALERIAFTLDRIGGLLEELSGRLRSSPSGPYSLPSRVATRGLEEADGDVRDR